jgi:hypothetical protein
MYYIGLDIHKKTISYCVRDASGQIERQGTIGTTRNELDVWMKYLPQPWAVAMEATIFTGWVYDHLLLHAAQVKVFRDCQRTRTQSSATAGKARGSKRMSGSANAGTTAERHICELWGFA